MLNLQGVLCCERAPPRARTSQHTLDALKDEYWWLAGDLERTPTVIVQRPRGARGKRRQKASSSSADAAFDVAQAADFFPEEAAPEDAHADPLDDESDDEALAVAVPFDATAFGEVALEAELLSELYTGFYLKPLGGVWTSTHIGVSFDRWAALARSGEARAWCNRFGWPKFKSFTIRKYQDGAKILAEEWVAKADHLFQIWQYDGSGLNDFSYSDAELNSYVYSHGFSDWACEQPDQSVNWRQAYALHVKLPRN